MIRRWRWALWAWGLISTAALASSQPPPAEVLKDLRTIESANLRGEIDPYRARYAEQVKANPNDVMSKVYLAWCSMPYDEAWNELKKVAAIYPEVPWPHYGMGRIYVRWKIRDQAERTFKLAIEDGGKNGFFPAEIGLADLLRTSGRHAEAQARYREILSIQDDAEARAGLGLSLLAQGRTAEARTELDRALSLWSDQPEVLNALANIARQENDTRSALRYAGKLTQIWPKDKAVRRTVADLQFELGDKDLAAEQYEVLVKLGERDPFVLKRLSDLYKELGNKEGMERTLGLLSNADPGVDSLVKLAELSEDRGSLEDADRRLTQALGRQKRLDILLRLARVKAKRQLLVEALELYRQAEEAGARADETAEAQDIAKRFKLPQPPISGNLEQIQKRVYAGLNALYSERLKENASLGGSLKVRVKVDAHGKVQEVELAEDTVNDPLIAGHVYFALKDAAFPKQRREPEFEFTLRPPLARSR